MCDEREEKEEEQLLQPVLTTMLPPMRLCLQLS